MISRVNEQFRCRFGIFQHTQQNVERCFERIEERNRQLSGGTISEKGIARPSESRQERAQVLRRELDHKPLAAKVIECRRLREQLIGGSKGANLA